MTLKDSVVIMMTEILQTNTNNMKINIWIKQEELFSGKISEYHTQNEPDNGYDPSKYINISLTADEFVKLQDDIDIQETCKCTESELEQGLCYEDKPDSTMGETCRNGKLWKDCTCC
jgi:hypothetical protein